LFLLLRRSRADPFCFLSPCVCRRTVVFPPPLSLNGSLTPLFSAEAYGLSLSRNSPSPLPSISRTHPLFLPESPPPFLLRGKARFPWAKRIVPSRLDLRGRFLFVPAPEACLFLAWVSKGDSLLSSNYLERFFYWRPLENALPLFSYAASSPFRRAAAVNISFLRHGAHVSSLFSHNGRHVLGTPFFFFYGTAGSGPFFS